MFQFKIALWIIAYTVGIIRFSVASLNLAKNRMTKDIWELAFFLVFTTILISHTNFEAIYSLKGEHPYFFRMLSLYGAALIVLTLPIYTHYLLSKIRRIKLRNRIFIALSSLCIVIITFSISTKSPAINKVGLYTTLILMYLTIGYSMIILIRDDWGKSRKEKDKLPLFILMLIPVLIGVDILILKSRHFIVMPLIYILVNSFKIKERILQLRHHETGRVTSQEKMEAAGLTSREREVADLIITGLTYQQAAEKLCVSLATLKTHVYRIYNKTDAHNKIEMMEKLKK